VKAPSPPRSPWQLLYGGGHKLRAAWYASRARRLPRPVVSVGNLHWGGSGKTPLTAAIAAHLRDRAVRVCILSRGYGSGGGGGVRVVSTGDGPLLGPLVAGDEPVLLAASLPGVAVVVGPDRFAAGEQALRRLDPAPDLFLLDDGFSHLRLARDLDLLAFPAADPFAGGRLFPSGKLREPLASAARAHAVLLTGAPPAAEGQAKGDTGEALAAALAPFGFRGQGFSSATEPGSPRLRGGAILAPGARVFVVAAIARPGSFLDLVRGLGFTVAGELLLGDHHPYPESTLRRLEAAFRTNGAEVVLTTSKDWVKLYARTDLPLAELPIAARPEAAFWRWLEERLWALVPGLR
jgi:tetraacyldisaccharide 4'-kinase